MTDDTATLRFRVTTVCAGCQAFPDARELFTEIENICRRHRLDDPERVARALAVLAAQWSVVSAQYTASVDKLSDEQADELRRRVLGDVQHALRFHLNQEAAAAAQCVH
jgi:hypothetical protein